MAKTFKIVDGDIVINPMSGRPTTISGSNKTVQDIREFFEVDIMPNGFGAGIGNLVGVLSFAGDSMFVGLVSRQINDGIRQYRLLQQSNTKIIRTTSERIVGVSGVRIEQNPVDPTMYYFRANVITEDGKVVAIPAIQIKT